MVFFFFQAEDGIRDRTVTGVQTCALPISRAHNAPELLGSQAMGELITGWRASYDVILIDTPPLGGGVDPLILGTLTGNLLLVLRSEERRVGKEGSCGGWAGD